MPGFTTGHETTTAADRGARRVGCLPRLLSQSQSARISAATTRRTRMLGEQSISADEARNMPDLSSEWHEVATIL